MRKFVFIIVLALMGSAAIGQKVDFSGSWKLNNQESDMGSEFSLAPVSLEVNHTRKSIELERVNDFQGEKLTTKDVITLNGEECENVGWMDAVKITTAVWDKKAKVMTITSKMEMDDGTNVEIVEELVMNEDNLVIESSASSDYGDLVERFVFDKQ